jgi:hypothetical protein
MFVVAATAERRSVAERNLRRALDDARETAGVDATADRVAWHLLRSTPTPRALAAPLVRADARDGPRAPERPRAPV